MTVRRRRRARSSSQPVRAELIDGRYRIGFVPLRSYKNYSVGAGVATAFSRRVTSPSHRQSLGGIVTGLDPRRRLERRRDRRAASPGRRRRASATTSDSRAHQPLARAPEPPAAPAARRWAHRVLARGEDSRQSDPARGLRAGLRDRHRARADALLHRPLERHQPSARRLSLSSELALESSSSRIGMPQEPSTGISDSRLRRARSTAPARSSLSLNPRRW